MAAKPSLTRRALLTGSMPGRHYISSAVIVALPARRAEVCDRLRAMPGVEVHAAEGSRIVVTIEGPTSGSLGETLAAMPLVEGVLSANMVFEHFEETEASAT